jgi:two-component system copper resistance phosphate regulon response regulator CusR
VTSWYRHATPRQIRRSVLIFGLAAGPAGAHTDRAGRHRLRSRPFAPARTTVTKPFAFEELLARRGTVAPPARAHHSVLKVADLTLNLDKRGDARRTRDRLTPSTVINIDAPAGRVMSRTLITEYAWGYHDREPTSSTSCTSAQENDANSPKSSFTVRGVGP